MFSAFRMARPWVHAIILQGFVASSLNLTAWDVASNGASSRLLRREQQFKLWEEMVDAATGEQMSPSFRAEIRRCNYSKANAEAAHMATTPLRSQTQRALREVKDVLAEHQVPLILLGGLALGYHNSCAAMVGDMDRVVATFGPWLEEVGLKTLSTAFERRGHHLETQHCKAGPLNAGCKLAVALFHRTPLGKENVKLDIEVLFAAPPAAVARLPGRFKACAATCGERCQQCGLAYAKRTQSLEEQDRFFPCPVPLRNFILAAWMNETFWIPENLESYLEAEYDSQKFKPHQACSSAISAMESLSSYETLVVLPKGSEVLNLQRQAEQAESPRIAAAAVYDRHLWHKYFAQDANSKSSSPWAFAETSATISPSKWRWFRTWHTSKLTSKLTSISACFSMRGLLLAIGVVLTLAAAYVIPKRLSVCSSRVLAIILGHPSDGGMFSIYMAILLGQTFSQYLANVSGLLALAAAIMWQCAHLVWATGVVWHRGGVRALISVADVVRSFSGSGRLLCFNAFLGICVAVSQWLSFVSLSWLDPASYILFVQVSMLLAEVPGSQQKFGKVHGLALAIVVLAFMVKGLQAATQQDMMLYRGLVAVLIQVLLSAMVLLCRPCLKEVENISGDSMVVTQSIQGLLFLLVIFALCCDRGSFRSNLVSNLSEVLSSEWILTSVAFLLVSNVIKSEFLSNMAAPIQELGVCGLLMKTAGLQWFILRWGGGDAYDLQMVFLGLMALAVCFAEHLASQPLAAISKPKVAKSTEAKKIPPVPPHGAVSKVGNAKVKSFARPPRPPAAKAPGRKASDFSEISTTAPSTPRTSGSVPNVPVTILQPRPRSRVRLREDSSSSSSELSSEWTSESE